MIRRNEDDAKAELPWKDDNQAIMGVLAIYFLVITECLNHRNLQFPLILIIRWSSEATVGDNHNGHIC